MRDQRAVWWSALQYHVQLTVRHVLGPCCELQQFSIWPKEVHAHPRNLSTGHTEEAFVFTGVEPLKHDTFVRFPLVKGFSPKATHALRANAAL